MIIKLFMCCKDSKYSSHKIITPFVFFFQAHFIKKQLCFHVCLERENDTKYRENKDQISSFHSHKDINPF